MRRAAGRGINRDGQDEQDGDLRFENSNLKPEVLILNILSVPV
jgi:hypothetical protein